MYIIIKSDLVSKLSEKLFIWIKKLSFSTIEILF
jgi:hypothetical protein